MLVTMTIVFFGIIMPKFDGSWKTIKYLTAQGNLTLPAWFNIELWLLTSLKLTNRGLLFRET